VCMCSTHRFLLELIATRQRNMLTDSLVSLRNNRAKRARTTTHSRPKLSVPPSFAFAGARPCLPTSNQRQRYPAPYRTPIPTAGSRGTNPPTQLGHVTAVSADTIVRARHLPEHANISLLQKHAPVNPSTAEGYWKKWNVLANYCACRCFNPNAFSTELAMMFAAFMMDRKWRGKYLQSLSSYFSAFNYVYRAKKLGQPWAGSEIAALQKSFRQAQLVRAAAEGQDVGSLRVAVPFTLVLHLLHKAESNNSRTTAAWYAIFLVMYLFLFRADTIAGIQHVDDCCILLDGTLRFCVRRLKRDRTVQWRPFHVSIPAPQPGSTRARIWQVLLKGLPFVPQLVRTWSKAPSTTVTQAMRDLLLPNGGAALIPPGSHISSHSWRKAGASSLAKAACSWFVIKTWGMWLSTTSAERYVELRYYDSHPLMRSIFDWLCDPARFSVQFAHLPDAVLRAADSEDVVITNDGSTALSLDPLVLGDHDADAW
jgi:hypothetical protein